jgi:hypothetical protein
LNAAMTARRGEQHSVAVEPHHPGPGPVSALEQEPLALSWRRLPHGPPHGSHDLEPAGWHRPECALCQSRVSLAAGSRPFTEFLHDAGTVADGNQNHFHARIGGNRVVDGTDRSDVLVVCEIGDDVTVLERVVQQYQASWPQAGQHLFVVLGVAGLVGVDEREVELLAGRQ